MTAAMKVLVCGTEAPFLQQKVETPVSRGTQTPGDSTCPQTCSQGDTTTAGGRGLTNYCRNINYRMRPGCYVRKNLQPVWEYCDIPHCGFKLFTPAPPPAPTEAQTAAGLTCGQRAERRQMKIVGGTVVTAESHPWFAAIFKLNKRKEKVFHCGGSLISPCWVLTATHCFENGLQNKQHLFSITLGKSALNQIDSAAEQTFSVEKILLHEEYNNSWGNYNNDIALLKLEAKQGRCAQETLWVKTVCLPPPQQRLQPGVTCEVSGFGKEGFGSPHYSQNLREAQVDLLADEVCRQEGYYEDLITDNMFCAARPDWSQDACAGDSGGPLACQVLGRLFLFGVVSWGDGCARENRPGVYARVTNYNTWIEEKTGLASIAAGTRPPEVI
ncbi:plasminogen activator, urokinase b isoform X4 [Kryptolebias marmoratus]|uniref:plasminogen activator, urokinase b isoform X4 n=1 Tax=Kryptolebias marmoratus TaxID=37003 RepID=UPI000D52F615|nr:plasminogen activator, urokinase b isoform X4 [Kryptolebias marmoratus]XP_024866874.1 plasminogen activator, urokinase b isoform X4 [Kryptolebias marmoratus]